MIPHGCNHDPARFLADLRSAGERWTPMHAARLVMGRKLADDIRDDMGEDWLAVTIAAHLATARDAGEWSFAHETLAAWLAHRRDELDVSQYRLRLAELAAAGVREFLGAPQ